MGYWSSLFETDTALWGSPLSPPQVVAAIERGFPSGFGFGYRTSNSGTTLRVLPRGRGRAVFAIELSAWSPGTGSIIESKVIPATSALATYVVVLAAMTCVLLPVYLAGSSGGWVLMLLPFCGLGTVVLSLQILAMGVVKRSAARRLAFRMRGAGAALLPPAGWFPDPSANGRLRWWDGMQWAARWQTDHGPTSERG